MDRCRSVSEDSLRCSQRKTKVKIMDQFVMSLSAASNICSPTSSCASHEQSGSVRLLNSDAAQIDKRINRRAMSSDTRTDLRKLL